MGAAAAALRAGAGLRARPGLAVHVVEGADARGFLHRMLSQDVRGIPDGAGRPALFLDARGRVQADPLVLVDGPRTLLVEAPEAAARAVPGLERYVIADDVRFTDASAAHRVLELVGAAAPGALAAAAPALARARALVADLGWRDRPALAVVVPAEAAADVEAALLAAGAVPVDDAAFDAARVEALAPRFGAELDDRVLPNEAGHFAAVSFTKGCYLGQEPVVMAKHRGRPPTLLVRGAAPGPAVPARDAPLRHAGVRAGRVTTAVARGPDVAALAFVRTDLAQAGVELALEDGRPFRVEAVAT